MREESKLIPIFITIFLIFLVPTYAVEIDDDPTEGVLIFYPGSGSGFWNGSSGLWINNSGVTESVNNEVIVEKLTVENIFGAFGFAQFASFVNFNNRTEFYDTIWGEADIFITQGAGHNGSITTDGNISSLAGSVCNGTGVCIGDAFSNSPYWNLTTGETTELDTPYPTLVNASLKVRGTLSPESSNNGLWNLGYLTNRWRNLFLSGNITNDNIVSEGNHSATYFHGDGSNLTGIDINTDDFINKTNPPKRVNFTEINSTSELHMGSINITSNNGVLKFMNLDDYSGGTSWITMDVRDSYQYGVALDLGGHGDNDNIRFNKNLQLGDQDAFNFGAESRYLMKFDTSWTADDHFYPLKLLIRKGQLGQGGNRYSGVFMIEDSGDERYVYDYYHSPTLAICSADDVNDSVSNPQCMFQYHNETDYVFDNKFGNFSFNQSVKIRGNLTLDNPVEEDLRFPASVIKVTGASNIPGWDATNYGYDFDASTMEQAYFIAQFPHSRKSGTNVDTHFHWQTADANAGDVVWCIEYTWANINGQFGAVSYECNVDSATGDATQHLMTPQGEISGSGFGSSSIMKGRLFRNATDPRDTYANDALLLEFDIHYKVDKLGETVS